MEVLRRSGCLLQLSPVDESFGDGPLGDPLAGGLFSSGRLTLLPPWEPEAVLHVEGRHRPRGRREAVAICSKASLGRDLMGPSHKRETFAPSEGGPFRLVQRRTCFVPLSSTRNRMTEWQGKTTTSHGTILDVESSIVDAESRAKVVSSVKWLGCIASPAV